ncbi:MAG: 3-hydroxyacyl-CoA dehydrogenase/enoyl-CoA hydratase family protein [Candidatus Thermoplasmatota archaeon]|nr:3-hydroxyacyl-CoA dehydrogenase/enoyl-CoA hydratase family protein [Candidatus Thermoplasmatota archaeon]MCL5881115.1 3-hydroxyacyl-CoA dehydrogenase/enoyl-CoA hydratase family protein [Candidatus Thermoplasmatota archaeon]
MEIRNVTVIGSGEMGHGIAEIMAINGYRVGLEDVSQEILGKAMENVRKSLEKLHGKGQLRDTVEAVMSRITTYTSLEESVKYADLVIEAVPEIEDLKRKVFSDLEKYSRKDAILASNTSNIRITNIAANLKERHRVAGLHFFNPPVLLKLVEVVKGEETSHSTVDTLYNLVKSLGKYPIRVMKDIPGFVVNRVNAPGTLLMCLFADSGIAGVEEVDAFMKNQGFPMGPFELADYVGVDVAYHSLEYFARTVNPDYGKCSLFSRLYNKNDLGMKTGRGFYDWSGGRPVIHPEKATEKITPLDFYAVEINEAVKLVEGGVASPEDIETGVRLGLNRKSGPVSEAKDLADDQVRAKLEELVKRFNNSVFEPAESIKKGRMKEVLGLQRSVNPQDFTGNMGTSFRNIILERPEKRIARITFNRPKYNTISSDLMDELESALKLLWNEREVSVVIITGQGSILSAGADLKEFTMSSYEFMESSRRGERIFEMLSDMPKLTMVVMKGFALGGGFEMSLACDIRIGTGDVKIGFPEVNLGLVPGWGGSQRLARIVGLGKAMELTVTGKRISGKEAHAMGILNMVAEDPDRAALEYARSIAEKSAPVSIALIKRLLNKGNTVPRDVGLEMEAFAAGVAFSTEDLKEGIAAFFEKREPRFKGR